MDLNAHPDKLIEEKALKVAGHTLICNLREAFPRFEQCWGRHLADWDGEEAGAFNDINQFAHFVVEELFNAREIEEVRRVFRVLDSLFLHGDEATRDLIGIGFIEDLSNITSSESDRQSELIQLLTPTLSVVWKEIERQWVGHNSLASLVQAEQLRPAKVRTWAELLNLPEL